MHTVEVQTKACFHCGRTGIVEVPVAVWPELQHWLLYRRAAGGRYIQDILPDMPPEYREMLITGIHPDCWKQLFAEENEEGWGW